MFSGGIFIILWLMSCPASYCLNSCNLNSTVTTASQANLTTDLTGTIAMLKKKFDELKSGAADALSSLTKNSERKRSF